MELTLHFQGPLRHVSSLAATTFCNEVKSLCDAGLRAQVTRFIDTSEKQEILHLLLVIFDDEDHLDSIDRQHYKLLKLPECPAHDLDNLWEIIQELLCLEVVGGMFRHIMCEGDQKGEAHWATLAAISCIEALEQNPLAWKWA